MTSLGIVALWVILEAMDAKRIDWKKVGITSIEYVVGVGLVVSLAVETVKPADEHHRRLDHIEPETHYGNMFTPQVFVGTVTTITSGPQLVQSPTPQWKSDRYA